MITLPFSTIARYRRVKAFTLVEVLIAELVFLILLGLSLTLSFAIIQTVQQERKGMDSLGEARLAMDRLSMDWNARVRRSDVSALFTKQAGNDQIGLLTQVPAYSGDRRLAWVSYQVGLSTNVVAGSQAILSSSLQRGLVGYNWQTGDAGGNPVLSFPFSGASVTVDPSSYEPLASTVFRMEFCLMQQISATNPSPFTVNPALNLASTNFVGVVVAVAALDQRSRQIVSQSQLTTLANALPDVTGDGQDPQSLWLPVVNSTNFAQAAGVPKPVAAAVHVFQRTFYLKD